MALANPVSTGAAAMGVSVPSVAVIVWIFSLFGVTVPTDIALYMLGIFGTGMHWIAVVLMTSKNSAVAALAAEVAKDTGGPVPLVAPVAPTPST